MIYFKSCTRCKGDVYLKDDVYGVFLTCLQCGFSWDQQDQQTSPERRQASEARPPHFEVPVRAKKAS